MVRLNTPTGSFSNGEFTPVMYVHSLVSTKDAKDFKQGNQYNCYITKNDNGRFAVFTSHGAAQTLYHVFESEQDLHNSFDEL
jgi:hypothetical protein